MLFDGKKGGKDGKKRVSIAHMRIAQQRLESAIAERDNFTVEIIDMYLSLMLKRDRIKEFMERRGYKIHEYD